MLKVVSHYDWGGHRDTLLQLYRALVRSKLDYGCCVYGSARKTYLKMLDPIVNQALRLCLGAFKTSPATSLAVEANEPPLELRRQKLSLQYIVKMAANPSIPTYTYLFCHPLNKSYIRKSHGIPPIGIRLGPLIQSILPNPQQISINRPFPFPPWQVLRSTVLFDLQTDSSKAFSSSTVTLAKFREICDKYQDYQFVYTDGSKQNYRVAAAAVISQHVLMQRLPDQFSIYSAELKGILIALDHIKTDLTKKYLFVCDSLSCLRAIQNMDLNHPFIYAIYMELERIFHYTTLIFCWAPSHIGIRGNELADHAAKDALFLPIANEKIPSSDLRPAITRLLLEQWQAEWNALVNNKLHNIIPTISKSFAINTVPNRRDQSILCRLRIGHTLFTHSYLLTDDEPPWCIPCHVPLTVEHILLQCHDFTLIRKQYYTAQSLYDLFHNIKPARILGYLKAIRLYWRL
jgi:ribonuclease HI